jgi:SSS family solute:Na+ symporter
MLEIKHLNILDHLVIGVYLLMVLVTGFYVSRFNKKSDDYFKGGGHIPWGLSAVSLFISGFSAFMFVGAAGVTYQNGGGALVLFSLALPAYLLGFFLYGPLWRRTRIDTPMQFLNRRFSPGTTYFYTLLSVIPNVLILGTMIYTLCIFVSTALGFNTLTVDLGVLTVNGFELSLLVIGAVMIIYTMLGGLWAVMVTDALQFLVLFLVTLTIFPLTYLILGDGNVLDGFSRLFAEAPPGYFAIDIVDRPGIFWLAYSMNIVLGYNVNWHIAQRYYSVPDERDTRRMALWVGIGSWILPMMWIFPVMASRILLPNLESMWPELAKPSEASFVTLALSILPHGMLGVMVAAILAATMSSVDTTFNWLAAVLTKDAYVPLAKRWVGREPSDRAQLTFGKTSVAVMGVIAVWIALNMGKFGGAFDVYLRADSLYKPSMFVPVMLGLIYTRTPWWSGMVAFGAGVGAILIVGGMANLANGIPLESIGSIFEPLKVTVLGIDLGRYEMNTLVGVGTSALVFFISAFFNRREGAFAERIESLEHDLATPAYAVPGDVDLRGFRAYYFAGRLAVVVGGLLVLLAIPADAGALNAVAGLISIALGVLVVWLTRRAARSAALATRPSNDHGRVIAP